MPQATLLALSSRPQPHQRTRGFECHHLASHYRAAAALINTSYVNAGVLQNFLLQLRKQYPLLPIIIVLDNARYQHCKAVIAFAENLGIKLLFLPPYSPNLNIIERLWKFAKKKVLYGKYYERADLFHKAIHDFFEQIDTHQNQPRGGRLNLCLPLNFRPLITHESMRHEV